MSFDNMVKEVASKGRFGDDRLLHISSEELSQLFKSGLITINPKTGLPEAFNLGSIGGALLNPVGAIGGLLGSLAPKPPEVGNLEGLAGPAGQQANALIPSVSTGNLPVGAQTQVNTAVNDAITSIKSKYASMGMSGSTVEAQEIAQAQARGQAMAFSMADELTRTGIAEAGLSANIYESIMKAQIEQDTALQNALSNFAGAAAIGFLGRGAGGGAGAGATAGGAGALAGAGGEGAITGGGFEELLGTAAAVA